MKIFIFILSTIIFFSCKNDSGEKIVILSEHAPKPIGPYSQAVMKNGMMFASGQIGINPQTNQLDTSSFESETKQVMENIKSILAEAELSFENVVKCTIYLTDLKNFQKMNEIYSAYFSEDSKFPVRETVQVSALPKNARIEISVIALK